MRRTLGAVVVLGLLFLGLQSACAAAPVAEKAAEELRRPAATGAPAAAQSRPGGAAQPASGSAGSAPAEPAAWDRMIIRTATLTLTVDNVADSLSAIRGLADASGGYVASAQTQYRGDQQVATVTIQVPARSFDGVIDQLRKLAVKVDNEQTGSQDVTEEYVDLQAQLRNLQATEASLQKLLDKATQMADVLAIQRELTNVRGQIERTQGRINYLQRRSDMSTITVSLVPPALSPSGQLAWQPLKTIQQAWASSLETLRGVVDALLSLLIGVWWLWALIALAVWLIRRNRARRPRPAPASPPPGGAGAPPGAAA